MAFLKYYEVERARWPQLQDAKCTPEQAAAGIKRLARWWAPPVRHLTVTFTSGRRYSRGGLQQGKPWVCLNRDHLNWRLVAHELAHAIHALEELPRLRPRIWHGPRHAWIVDRLCQYILEQGWITNPPAPTILERVKAAASEPSPEERQAQKLAHAEGMLRKAMTRAKRADTILRKWTRRVKRLKAGN